MICAGDVEEAVKAVKDSINKKDVNNMVAAAVEQFFEYMQLPGKMTVTITV